MYRCTDSILPRPHLVQDRIIPVILGQHRIILPKEGQFMYGFRFCCDHALNHVFPSINHVLLKIDNRLISRVPITNNFTNVTVLDFFPDSPLLSEALAYSTISLEICYHSEYLNVISNDFPKQLFYLNYKVGYFNCPAFGEAFRSEQFRERCSAPLAYLVGIIRGSCEG